MLLEVTFGKLYAWAIQNVRNILLDANAKFKELGEYFFRLAVGWGERCFKLTSLHSLKFPVIGILKLIPLLCANKYFDLLSLYCLLSSPPSTHFSVFENVAGFPATGDLITH